MILARQRRAFWRALQHEELTFDAKLLGNVPMFATSCSRSRECFFHGLSAPGRLCPARPKPSASLVSNAWLALSKTPVFARVRLGQDTKKVVARL